MQDELATVRGTLRPLQQKRLDETVKHQPRAELLEALNEDIRPLAAAEQRLLEAYAKQ